MYELEITSWLLKEIKHHSNTVFGYLWGLFMGAIFRDVLP